MSSFIYGFSVTMDNNTFVIDETGTYINCVIRVGQYSYTEYAQAVQDALNSYGGQIYTVTAQRDRKLLISALSQFKVLPTHIGSAIDAHPMMGFTVDTDYSTLHESDSLAGSEYFPQYMLQDYSSLESNIEYRNKVINRSTNGTMEVISYGTDRYMECNIKLITDLEVGDSPIVNNQNGVFDAVNFLTYCSSKGKIEFIPDLLDRNTFHTLRLHTTQYNSDGMGFKLTEDSNFRDVYETGLLKFLEA